jgi:hypothetical protein
MIFEEIECAGGEIVSVSENIDNSLTGKLIRSILAWSAESEREKILEYANRRWQTRRELGLPLGVGYAPYGWSWGDKSKTSYVINKEEAAVRLSLFQMFVVLEMSLRAIAHKLTEDGILTPKAHRRQQVQIEMSEDKSQDEEDEESSTATWSISTVRKYLQDPINIGILVICKGKKVTGPSGKRKEVPHPDRLEIPGGIPRIDL